MTMQIFDFNTITARVATAIQGASAGKLIDMTTGSVLRAVAESYAATVLWLQGMILQLLTTTRAASSTGTDLDTWMADYGLTRLPAQAASGRVTLSRFTATSQAVVPVDATIQTGDGKQRYTVVVDTSSAAYSSALGGYVMAAGTSSVSVPVLALTAGAAGNAAAGQINTITQAMPGVDTVSNPGTFTNGMDAESDAAFRIRFVAFLAGLSKATPGAVTFAATSLQSGVTCVITEGYSYSGAWQPGYFFLVVDDGSGAPTAAFLAAVYAAVDAVRPVGSTFGVFAPVTVMANVAMTITVDAAYDRPTAVAAVTAAIRAYLSSLTIGQTLPLSRLTQIAYNASPGVSNVSGVTINGATADLTATTKQAIRAGTVTIG